MSGHTKQESISPWRDCDGELFCRNCGCRQGTGHHPSCIEADIRTDDQQLTGEGK